MLVVEIWFTLLCKSVLSSNHPAPGGTVRPILPITERFLMLFHVLSMYAIGRKFNMEYTSLLLYAVLCSLLLASELRFETS